MRRVRPSALREQIRCVRAGMRLMLWVLLFQGWVSLFVLWRVVTTALEWLAVLLREALAATKMWLWVPLMVVATRLDMFLMLSVG